MTTCRKEYMKGMEDIVMNKLTVNLADANKLLLTNGYPIPLSIMFKFLLENHNTLLVALDECEDGYTEHVSGELRDLVAQIKAYETLFG